MPNTAHPHRTEVSPKMPTAGSVRENSRQELAQVSRALKELDWSASTIINNLASSGRHNAATNPNPYGSYNPDAESRQKLIAGINRGLVMLKPLMKDGVLTLDMSKHIDALYESASKVRAELSVGANYKTNGGRDFVVETDNLRTVVNLKAKIETVGAKIN